MAVQSHFAVSCCGMSDAIRDYRDLVAWQRAMDLAIIVDAVCGKLPRHEWKTAAQMRESSKSIYRNIAEGNGRFSIADYLRCLGLSNGSLNELESDLEFIVRRYPAITEAPQAVSVAIEVRRPLRGLVVALRKKLKGR
jgi:four helix bundle protein